jgi:hypothetical protein
MPEYVIADAVTRSLEEAQASGDRDGLTEIAVLLDGSLPPPADVPEDVEGRELATG